MEYYSKRTTITVLLLIASLSTSITLIAYAAETNNYNNTSCIETEKRALLAFKKSLKDPYDILSSWNDSSKDCCAWEYVVCDHLTGHVCEIHLQSRPTVPLLGGMISPSLLDLKHLAYLDLSFNDFDGREIPSFIGSMASLEYLNLAYSQFQAGIPYNFRNLSGLRTLDLSGQLGEMDNIQSLSGLVSLEHLSLNSVNLSRASSWFEVVNELPNLIELHLYYCSLYPFPPDLVRLNFTSLEVLDLSHNNFDSPVPSWIFNLSNLVWLDLQSSNLRGPIPTDKVGEFQRLQILNLAYNSFTGSIPFGLGNVSSLISLLLSENKFVGNIPSSLGLLLNLSYLYLSNNKLVGNIPFNFGQLSNLKELYLENNMLVGNIPFSFGQLSNLEILSLSSNMLVGNIPSSFGQLSNLEHLSLDNNMLEGIVTENQFSNLSKLTFLLASENSLTLSVGEDWNPPFQLIVIDLGSWILGSQIPSWFQTQTILENIGLSNTGISGEIPTWFWSLPRLLSFNLSHNHLSGDLPHSISINDVCLSSNNFSGPLPLISNLAASLDLSNNSFSGGTARTLCIANRNHDNQLSFLHLGGNNLSGEIPDCWINWSSLSFLNLGNNNFIGKIPASIGLLGFLRSLNLYNNSLSGNVPSSLQNCTELIKIDLSGNKLEGINITSPPPELKVLILRSNHFSGQIAPEICMMRDLHVLDIAHNRFSGDIPICLDNLTFMSSQNEQATNEFDLNDFRQYIVSASVTTKGSKLQYDTILPLFSIIDLSSNRLSGSIPKELTGLAGLRSLNLSGNYLSGSIPDNIGDMASLESLDLSENNISGEIPIGLARLTALDYLNLSYNDLSGRIPTSTQLQSFSPSTFIGNKLCGLPLSDKCDENNNSPPENNKEASEIDMWFYVCMSFGFIAGFWVWWLALIFKESWRHAYFELLDDLWNRVCGFCVS